MQIENTLKLKFLCSASVETGSSRHSPPPLFTALFSPCFHNLSLSTNLRRDVASTMQLRLTVAGKSSTLCFPVIPQAAFTRGALHKFLPQFIKSCMAFVVKLPALCFSSSALINSGTQPVCPATGQVSFYLFIYSVKHHQVFKAFVSLKNIKKQLRQNQVLSLSHNLIAVSCID